MSTKMNDEDWRHTVAVFRACLPRRGRKANDDRRFLEALHFFTVENVRWRTLGMLTCMKKAFDFLAEHKGVNLDLATIRQKTRAPTQ
jgi:hypothetical protein